MKHYRFKMKDGYDGSIFEGNVDGEDWREAWIKLSPLMKAGHKIIEVEDLDDLEEVEESDMSILRLIKPGEAGVGEEATTPTMFMVSFSLITGEQIPVVASEELADQISTWYNDPYGEGQSETISLVVEGIVIYLDRSFVGAVFVKELNIDEDLDEAEEEDLIREDEF